MVRIEIEGDAFDVALLSGQSTPSTVSLRVQYESGRLTRTAVVDVDAEHRSDLTVGTVESTLQGWVDANPEKRIASFEFVEQKPARRCERIIGGTDGGSSAADAARETAAGVAEDRGGSSVGASTIQSVSGAEPVEGTDGYAPGDLVVYVVGGIESGVYRHTSDGIISGVPPCRRGPAGDEVREYFLLDIGGPGEAGPHRGCRWARRERWRPRR